MAEQDAAAAKVWYPLFLDIEGKRTIVVGGGKVGLRKAQGLMDAGAHVYVVSPHFHPGFEDLTVARIERPYQPGDLEGAHLAFAATNDRTVNHQVSEDARKLGIPANIADAPQECNFIVPARATVDGIQIAISTGGADPRRAAALRKRIDALLNPPD